MTAPLRVLLLAAALAALPAESARAADPSAGRAVGADASAGGVQGRGSPELVILNDGRALVRQPVTLDLPGGTARLELGGLPPRIDSTSIGLESQGVRVRRQAYRFDTWDADLVFHRFLGDSIVYRYGGRRYRGVLTGIDGDDLFILRADSADVLTM